MKPNAMKATKLKNTFVRKRFWTGRALFALAGMVLAPGTAFAQTITATLDGSQNTRQAPVDFFGFNGENRIYGYPGGGATENAWNSTVFQDALVALKPRTIRFPGGAVANFWDWKGGWFIPEGNDAGTTGGIINRTDPSPLLVPASLPTKFQTSNLVIRPTYLSNLSSLYNRPGANFKPIFVLNMLTEWAPGQNPHRKPNGSAFSDPIDYQIGMLREARDVHGLPVEYIELGNEYYLNGSDPNEPGTYYGDKWPSGNPERAGVYYGQDAVTWIGRIRAEFPDAKISVVGRGGSSDFPRSQAWNDNLKTGLGSVRPDAFTFHYYDAAGLQTKEIIATAFKSWSTTPANDLSILPSGVDAWFTEFNHLNSSTPTQDTWAQGLTAAAYAVLFSEDSRVTMMVNHTAVGNGLLGALFYTDSALNYAGGPSQYFNAPDPETQLWGKSSAGYTLGMVSALLNSRNLLDKVVFSNNPTVTNPKFNYPALIGLSSTTGADEYRKAILLNLGDTDLYVNMATLFPRGGTYTKMKGSNQGGGQSLDYSTGKIINGVAQSAHMVNGATTYPSGGFPVVTTTFAAASFVTLPAYSITSLGGSVAGSGTGLKGQYYNNYTNPSQPVPTGTAALTRTDATINFDWASGSPGGAVNADNFAARWGGKVQPRYTGTYTFHVTANDGIRLWVNGSLIINRWSYSAAEVTGTIALDADKKYDIVMEYYEATGSATAKLSWSLPGVQSKQIVPQSRLFPAP